MRAGSTRIFLVGGHRITSPADNSLSHELRSILTGATIAAAALVVGATFSAQYRQEIIPHSARAADWEMACGKRCELRTIAREGQNEGQWIGLVYVSATDARVVSGARPPMGAAVTFDDGRRFVFDICDDEACRLPPAGSAALLQRLRTDDTGTLRVRLAVGGTTGLIDLPRLTGNFFPTAGPPPQH